MHEVLTSAASAVVSADATYAVCEEIAGQPVAQKMLAAAQACLQLMQWESYRQEEQLWVKRRRIDAAAVIVRDLDARVSKAQHFLEQVWTGLCSTLPLGCTGMCLLTYATGGRWLQAKSKLQAAHLAHERLQTRQKGTDAATSAAVPSPGGRLHPQALRALLHQRGNGVHASASPGHCSRATPHEVVIVHAPPSGVEVQLERQKIMQASLKMSQDVIKEFTSNLAAFRTEIGLPPKPSGLPPDPDCP